MGGDCAARKLIAGTSFGGDLVLMRVERDRTTQGAEIEREEYAALEPNSFAIDAHDNVYVTARAGGREANQVRVILCQLPAIRATPRCFGLAGLAIQEWSMPLVDDVVVPEPGIVYVRTGSDLRRYELPPL